MKVLFVGATGAIGKEVVPLLKPHFELRLTALESGEVADMPVQALDICDFEATAKFIREAGVDAVVNSAIADYRDLRNDRGREVFHRYHESMFEVNVRGAYHLYEAVALAGVKKFVFISSITVVAGRFPYQQLAENETARPFDIYGCTKHFGEEMGQVYAMDYEMSVTCLRLGQPYPLHTIWEEERMRMEKVRALYVHMEDIARAIGCALGETKPFATYPIVSASDVSFVDPSCYAPLGYEPLYCFTPRGPESRKR